MLRSSCVLIAVAVSIFVIAPRMAHAYSGAKLAPTSFAKIQTVRPWELRRLSGAQKLNYYRALQTLVTALENGTGGHQRDRNAWLNLVLPWVSAADRAGDDCIIGGYMSTWYRKENGNLSCGAPKEDQIFDVASGPKDFFCSEGSGSNRKAFCNSAVFLYSGDSSGRFCQPLENFSQNCQKAFENRYGRTQGESGDPHFPQRLVADFERFSKSMPPQELDQYYDDYDKFLNHVIESNNFDAKTADIVRRQIGVLQKTRDLATAMPAVAGPAVTAPASPPPTGTAGASVQAPSTAPPNAGAPAQVATNPAPSASEAPATKPSTSPYAGPGDEGSDEAAENPPGEKDKKETDDSKLLGKELSCVRDGLKKLGYKPSERYLALVGTGVQAANGAYDSNQDASRQMFRSRVISMIQSYGFCDEDSYPSHDIKPHHLGHMRRWLTADGGKAQPKLGLAYCQQMMDPSTHEATAREFYDVYGLRTETKSAVTSGKKKKLVESLGNSVDDAFTSIFVQNEKEWSEMSLPDRQDRIHSWKRAKAGSDFDSCHKNASERRDKDKAFRLHAMRLPPLGKDGKLPPLSDARKNEINEIKQSNRQVCEAMAAACGVDAGKACASPGAAGTGDTPDSKSAPASAKATGASPASSGQSVK